MNTRCEPSACTGGCGCSGSLKPLNAGRVDFTVALAGQPNCGKSTLFNCLTGARQRVGNWPGQTVERREGAFQREGQTMRIVDLPGAYTLETGSVEEQIASRYIQSGVPDLIIAVLNAASPRRSLYFLSELSTMGLPLIVVLNMQDVANAEGVFIDTDELQNLLQCPVIPMTATSNEGVDDLKALLASHGQRPLPVRKPFIDPSRYRDFTSMITTRSQWIETICEKTVRSQELHQGLTACWDKWLLHPFFGRFFAGIAGPLAVALGIILGLMTGGKLLEKLDIMSAYTKSIVPGVLGSFLGDSLLVGASWTVAIAIFIFFTYGIFCFLQDIGYFSRIAYFADGLLRPIGLTGKAAIPVLLGLICTTVAITSTRVIENRRQRLITVGVLPFLPCLSQTFVAIFLIMALFPLEQSLLMVLALTVINLIFAVAASKALAHLVKDTQKDHGLIMELPLYHKPNLKTIMADVFSRVTQFIKGSSPLIMAGVFIVWSLSYFPNGDISTSYMYSIGKMLEPFGQLMGMDWRFLVALFSSFLSKEMTASTLAVLFSISSDNNEALSSAIAQSITPAGALAFAVASNFYLPCISSMAVLRRETYSWRWLAIQVAAMLILAFSAAILTYQIGRLIF